MILLLLPLPPMILKKVKQTRLLLPTQNLLLLASLLIRDCLRLVGQALALLPLYEVSFGLDGLSVFEQQLAVDCAGWEVGVVLEGEPDADGGGGHLAV